MNYSNLKRQILKLMKKFLILIKNYKKKSKIIMIY